MRLSAMETFSRKYTFYTLVVVTVNSVERKRRQQFDKDDIDDLHQFEDPNELEFDEVAQPLEKRNCWVILFIMLFYCICYRQNKDNTTRVKTFGFRNSRAKV